ncbi:ECF transporter S component [Microbacterium sp. W4I20]|uniref:ECF transporter S component n=1 Tax=Microbacterium sp. W4I20 TaxID=3042262 RepID=UPI00278B6D72|nr:ECF transporter S component [Microbacterium sp. W4I20]MDQ0727179.1 ABC-type thiamine/hydroxymethylpyrimidine transport system permease subunit [Microbacterium sp. W4I20]
MKDARVETPRRVRTSALLVSAAFGAVQSLLFVAVVPLTSVLAVSSPPAYALVAGIHTLMPFLARVVTRTPGMATFTAFVTGLLTSAISPIGPLAAVPMLLAGLAFDLSLPLRREKSTPSGRILLAAAATGAVLFLVALPVFSPEHLVPPVLIATFAARIGGELAIGGIVIAVHKALVRAGVAR